MAATPPAPVTPTRPSSSSCRTRCCLLQVSRTKPSAVAACVINIAATKHPRRRLAAAAALPETAAACVAAAGLVGIAAALLAGRPASPSAPAGEEEEEQQQQQEECSDCGGTGLCPRCKGEGFVFKQLPEEAATKARKAAKNMATRYTSGLPTKWTYCNRCSSTRSCTTCGGSGTITTVTTN